MVCVGLKDPQRNFLLHTFSQPIPLPTECVTIAYNRTLQNVAEQFVGYDITIDEAVKLHIPFTNEKDWCSALTGMFSLVIQYCQKLPRINISYEIKFLYTIFLLLAT